MANSKKEFTKDIKRAGDGQISKSTTKRPRLGLQETDSDSDSESSEDDNINLALEDEKDEIKIKCLKKEQNEKTKDDFITTPYLTKFERAKVIGTRAQHIAMGAPVTIETYGVTNPIEIAKLELKAKKLDMIVRRFLPGGKVEEHHVRDLIAADVY